MPKPTLLFIWFVFLLFYCSTPSFGVEIYSFLDKKCKLEQGLIIGSEAGNFSLLSLSGELRIVKESETKFLLVHNTLENPFSQIPITTDLQKPLFDIYIGPGDQPLFRGWAVRFIENLVIFFDIKGNTHAVELYKITKIRPASMTPKTQFRRTSKTDLHLGTAGKQCKIQSRKGATRPTRIMSDSIQISELLGGFKKGFEDLSSYKERTYLYAKPYLYEKQTRMGFEIAGDKKHQIEHFPIYIQWSNGSEYRFQSFNQIGSVAIEYLPSLDPDYVFRSNLKSHLFHASFVGNLKGISAGTEVFTPSKDAWLEHLENDEEYSSRAAPSFNYLAFMGADWEAHSFSIGTYFANQVMVVFDKKQKLSEFREILASNVSPIFMYSYFHDRLKWSVIFSSSSTSSNNVKDLDLSMDEDTSVEGTISSYNYKSRFLRANADYQISSNLSVGGSAITYVAEYSEFVTLTQNFMNMDHTMLQLRAKHSFGEYVAIILKVNNHMLKRDYSFNGFNKSETEDGTSIGGSFEFVF